MNVYLAPVELYSYFSASDNVFENECQLQNHDKFFISQQFQLHGLHYKGLSEE